MNEDFLNLARTEPDISFCSESKIINQLQSLGKPVIVSCDTLESIQSNYSKMKELIERQKSTHLVQYHINSDESIVSTTLSKTILPEAELMNVVRRAMSDYLGYLFVVDDGVQCMYLHGELANEVETVLIRNEHMKARLGNLKKISDLPCVFDHFEVECHHESYNSACFQEDLKIASNIREQELRNILMHYLDRNIGGKVQTEFCTDYENDEESVDIYLYDGTVSAMIEVKIAFAKAKYAGKTNYSLKERARKGYDQLDKYAKHLEKDLRKAHYGYLYIFHMLNGTDETVVANVEEVKTEKFNDLSSEFHSMYSGTILNNMNNWIAQSVH